MERDINEQAKEWRKLMEEALNIARFAYENFYTSSAVSKLEIMRDLSSKYLLSVYKLSIDI